ncbi:DUF4011 domain-containing protein [Brevibacterium luteolum]|uniref:DUF4011 domain-containing protein n=1 Tax=Brevibacterium luteolum TaxID=199591 RepID=UPI00223BEEE6|nr:DUF4011 domain-containing protein [Brevibacterium luteolum]MCT1873934.1 DUF4011 domain-containing protein [Brevibacterium luteolum]MCT1891232.1 DUF4011 domain-containing protein [Brevibacterium luteolum]MCT1893834.1 DUF4011 domain-containing protein [Brevibacterium luteolum]MCT1923936.1 DUF4011 domain-containing protein [Brevibacterium luteolum]
MSSTEHATKSTVGEAFAAWKARAAKIGGRDTMLQYRDSRDGSIELTGAHPSGLAQLLAGRPTRLSSLIRDHDQLSDARRRARSIRQKADQLASERGINTAHLAIGFATWSEDSESGARLDYAAPVMLRHVRLVPRGSRVEDYEIVLDESITINPALVDFLHREHDIAIDVDEWVASTGYSHGFDPNPVFERLRDVARSVPGLLVNQRLIVSTFANIVSPYTGEELPEAHPILRALAGETDALPEPTAQAAADAEAGTASGPVPLPDRKPQEEFLAIDVDGDQQAVVDAAVAGQSLVVDTPPGTGATQLATAIATTLAHTGRSVLYVAQNSDALDDFATRMEAAGLPDLAIDGRDSARDIHRQLIRLIAHAEKAERPDLGTLLQRLNEQRDTLSQHAESLHRTRQPWGVSVYQTMQHLARLTAQQPGPTTGVRFGDDIMAAEPGHRSQLREKLLKLSTLGAFTLEVEDTVWFGARFNSDADAEAARSVAERVAAKIPQLTQLCEPVLRDAGLNPERTVAGWGQALKVLLGVRRTLDKFSPDVYEHNLSELIAATGSNEYRAEHDNPMGMMERRRLKKAAREFLRPGAHVDDLHSALIAARDERAALKDLAGGGTRLKVPRGLLDADEKYQEVQADLDKLSPVMADTPDGGDLDGMLVEELHARLQAMGVDKEALADLPARTHLDAELRQAGLGELIDDLRSRRASHDLVGEEFDLAYWATVLQRLAAEDPQIGQHDSEAMHRTAADFRICDRQYVAAGAQRLQWSHALGWKHAIGEHGEQAQALRTALRSRQFHVEPLSLTAPDVLGALAPVWLMSPFDVPQYFADLPLFDTVILADAGRMSVPEVLPAIARAKQVIAMGDDRLLGPRDFSVAVDRRTVPNGSGTPSVLAELREFLPVRRLHTSYRLSPAGLLGLVNEQFYDGTITGLPSAHTNEGTGLEFAYVPDAFGSPDTATGQVESLDAEVQRVVDLVLKHARTNARQSLAVITLTPWHAKRVAAGIQQAIRQYPYVASFFSDGSKEPFVVTDCKQIQGMARDAVIFSLGYGRTRQGRVIYNFGALSEPDGEKLLAAAVTRARRKLTLVSCFEADDFDPARLRHGAAVLPDLLAAVAAGGLSPQADTAPEAEGTERAESAASETTGDDEADDAAEAPAKRVGNGSTAASRLDEKDTDTSGAEPETTDTKDADADAETAPVEDSALELAIYNEVAPVIDDLAERLIRMGVEPHAGYAGIDLAVAVSAAGDEGMAVAVESDGASYASRQSIRERERLRPENLARHGWRSLRVWTTDAFVDPQREAERIFEVWKDTVEELSPQAVLNAARAAAVVVGRQGNRPRVTPGLPVYTYSAEDLDAMLDWIQSDGVSRTDAGLKDQLRSALAVKSRAHRVDSVLTESVQRFRRRANERKSTHAGTGQREEDVFVPAADAGPDQTAVMPQYDTGKLREQELLDAGLIDSDEAGSSSAAAEDSKDNSAAVSADSSSGSTAAERKSADASAVEDSASPADADEPAEDAAGADKRKP